MLKWDYTECFKNIYPNLCDSKHQNKEKNAYQNKFENASLSACLLFYYFFKQW